MNLGEFHDSVCAYRSACGAVPGGNASKCLACPKLREQLADMKKKTVKES